MLLTPKRMLAKAAAIGWSEDVCVIPPLSRQTRRFVSFTARSTQHNACNKAGRNPDCTEDIARTPEFVGGIPSGGDLGDDTLDHRAGDAPGRCRLPPICYSPRAGPGPRRSNARSRSRACTATPPLVLPRRAGTWSREVWMPRLHDRQRKGATTDVVAMRRDRQARAVCRVYELPAAEVADLRSAYESGDHRF
jgi:hypothetical protein